MSVYIAASKAEARAEGPRDEDARPGTSPTLKLGGMFPPEPPPSGAHWFRARRGSSTGQVHVVTEPRRPRQGSFHVGMRGSLAMGPSRSYSNSNGRATASPMK